MKLSVCIPVYNVAPYIEQCARSLFAQAYENIEYVFVDDCSPDESVSLVKRVLDGYPHRRRQVKFIRHERNLGLIASRKTAIRAATGELLAHCDSDDFLDEDLYATMIERLMATDADMVICPVDSNLLHRKTSGPTLESLQMTGLEAVRRMDEIPNLNAMYNKVMRREIADLSGIEWPESISIAEDFCCMMQLLPRCRRLAGVSGSAYHYRINENSMTRSRRLGRLVRDHMAVFDILSRRLPKDASAAVLRYLSRTVLFWGTVAGMLDRHAYFQWRNRLLEYGGTLDFSDRSLWGQRLMKLAAKDVRLSRFVSMFVRSRVLDIL